MVLVHGFATEGILTWYVPDLFIFEGSTTDAADRSRGFQVECLAVALYQLGVERCTAVGFSYGGMVAFSYGGMVAFKMAELRPDLVTPLVISRSVYAMTDSISKAMLSELRFASSSELLFPQPATSFARPTSMQCLLSLYDALWNEHI
ncbi:hypothetical protein Cni_G16259 [Canna indica]|uniref:AB hydrolase-1 domain-containing protein n=1 Tax=Canna indica TaxID=4628 RepID=A0AAQ3QFH4_9LILI|nr:hypothetical protein Cni_G16259 [Canna indica]